MFDYTEHCYGGRVSQANPNLGIHPNPLCQHYLQEETGENQRDWADR